jgi:hypothetical protein
LVQAADWATAPAAQVLATAPAAQVLATAPEELVVAIGPAELGVAALAEPIALAAGIFRAAAAGTGMPSGEVPGDTTDQARVAAAAVALPVWDLAVEVAGSAAAAEAGEDRPIASQQEIRGKAI